MKKIIKSCLFIVFGLLFLPLFAEGEQALVPLGDWLRRMEELTDYTIYYRQEDVAGKVVSAAVRVDGELDALSEAVKAAGLQMSVYGRMVFVLKDRELLTALTIGERQADTSRSVLTPEWLEPKPVVKAASENLVYEVGRKPASGEGPGVASLTGLVTDFKSGEPVPGVSIFVEGGAMGVVTDREGRYRLELPTGKHELSIRGAGVKSTGRQVMLYAAGTLDIELEEEAHRLAEVTVSSERQANVRGTAMGVERLKIKEMKHIPAVFGETDVIRIVMALPGVKSAGEISSGFNVRGGSTDQNLILFNEGTVYNPTHLFGLFSVFNPDLVDHMEFYKSSVPVKYGGRISSVLEISGKEGSKEQFAGSASIGLLTSRLMLEVPLVKRRTSLVVGGRTTYSDWLLKYLPEKSGYNNGRAGFYDLNLLLDHRVNDRNTLAASGYFSRDNFSFAADERYAYQNATASLKWRYVRRPDRIATYTAGYDHYDYTTRNESHAPTAYRMSFGIDQVYGKADFKWMLRDGHTLSFGLNALFYMLQPGKNLPAGDASLVEAQALQQERALESALYAGYLWDINHKLSVDAGVRLSMYNVLGPRSYHVYDPSQLPSLPTVTQTVEGARGLLKTYAGPELRLSARYAFTNDFSVKAGVSNAFQYIHKISNTTVMSPTDTWKLSDVNIKPQRGVQASVGVYKNFLNGMIETSLEAYYKHLEDYLDYRPGAVLVMNPHIETDVVQTQGQAYGVELMVKKPSGKLNGWVSYAYSRTMLRQVDERLESPINGGEWYPADFDKPHEVKLVGNYKFTQRYSFSVNCDYSTGRPITLPVSKFYYYGEEYVYYSGRNRFRVPDYFRMDLAFNIEPRHNLKQLTHSSISFGVYNVTGRKNVYSVYYISEDGLLKGYQMSIFGVPIPYVSYNIRF